MRKKTDKGSDKGAYIDNMLSNLRAESPLPAPSQDLTPEDLKRLVLKVGGPRTVMSILKARDSFPASRIPWLFSSLDTQAVIDILHYDLSDVLASWVAQSKERS